MPLKANSALHKSVPGLASVRPWRGGDEDNVCRGSLKENTYAHAVREIGSKCKVEGPLKTMATSKRRRVSKDC